MSVPSDKQHTNFTVQKTLVCNGQLVTANATVAGQLLVNDATINNQLVLLDDSSLEGDVLTNVGGGLARWSPALTTSIVNNGPQFDSIQTIMKMLSSVNFQLYNHIAAIQSILSGGPVTSPTWNLGRTITFVNSTTTVLDVYLTLGVVHATPTLLFTLQATGQPGDSQVWNIPDPSDPANQNFSGNFAGYPTGDPPLPGATLAEFGLNQWWACCTPPERDSTDISTVSPGIGAHCANGPHGFPPPCPPHQPGNNQNCVYYSLASGFGSQQSLGFNIGMSISNSAGGGSLPTQTVTCTSSNGDSPESVTFPNDTAFPKQQTGQAIGNYTVTFMDPVLSLPGPSPGSYCS